jgi:hypothetical protein
VTASPLDERAHRDVIAPLLTATLGANRVCDYGGVPGADNNPGTVPDLFALPAFERRYVEPYHAGRATRSGWRLTVRYVGRTVDEARWAALKVATALNEVRVTIGGIESTPITHESTQAIAPDDGRFSGWSVWTYAL